jgi:hypothetical protein
MADYLDGNHTLGEWAVCLKELQSLKELRFSWQHELGGNDAALHPLSAVTTLTSLHWAPGAAVALLHESFDNLMELCLTGSVFGSGHAVYSGLGQLTGWVALSMSGCEGEVRESDLSS